jgi:hypothetical protein
MTAKPQLEERTVPGVHAAVCLRFLTLVHDLRRCWMSVPEP